MKKWIALLLSVLLLLGLAACGDDSGEEKADKKDKETTSQKDPSSGMEETTKPGGDNDQQGVTGQITAAILMELSENPASDFEYRSVGQGKCCITKYVGSSDIVVIPETIDGNEVVELEGYLFAMETPVKAVRIADTVTEVGSHLFFNNQNLEVVVLGKQMCSWGTKNGISAFQNSSNLREVILSDGLETIGECAFAGCDSLTYIEIPASVTSIDLTAFVLMPEGFTIIGEIGSYAEQYATEYGILFQAK